MIIRIRSTRSTAYRSGSRFRRSGRGGNIRSVSDLERPETIRTGRMAARYKEMVCKEAAWSIFYPTLLLPTLRRRTAATRKERRAATA